MCIKSTLIPIVPTEFAIAKISCHCMLFRSQTLVKAKLIAVIYGISERDRQFATHNNFHLDYGSSTRPRDHPGASHVHKKLLQTILAKYFRKFLHDLAPPKVFREVIQKIFCELRMSNHVCQILANSNTDQGHVRIPASGFTT